MSDAAILADEDPREFRSPFDLALDSAAGSAFKWLVLGHILFAAGLFLLAVVRINPYWLTPLFGLPLVWAGRGHRVGVKVAVLLVGFTLAHWLAIQAAAQVDAVEHPMLPGLVSGGIGAGLSLLLIVVSGLARPGVPTAIFAVFGAALMAGIGSLVVYLYMTTGAGGGADVGQWVQLLKIYTPWQIAFAYVLAKVLRPDGGMPSD